MLRGSLDLGRMKCGASVIGGECRTDVGELEEAEVVHNPH